MNYVETLGKFVTSDLQLEVIEAIDSEGSQVKAAKFLNISERQVRNVLKDLRKGYVVRDSEDVISDIPDPPDGSKITSWRFDKARNDYIPNFASAEKDSKELSQDISKAFENYKPISKVKSPKVVSKDLLSLYTISDFHLGMLSWGEESGVDWDLKIAKKCAESLMSNLISRSPDSGIALLNLLGDFCHFDSQLPVTPASGHILETDTRYYKLLDTAAHLLLNSIERLLEKHKKVVVLSSPGNHDPSSSQVMQIALDIAFKDNPRVEIIKDPKVYSHYVFGKTVLFFHHGHKLNKTSTLAKEFSSDPFFAKDWGNCDHRYCHTGHLHHLQINEDAGMSHTQHSTVCPKSVFESSGGWNSQRAAILTVYHNKFGEYENYFYRPEMS